MGATTDDLMTNDIDGPANTTKIINKYTTTGTYAAQICRNINADWYLPTKSELIDLANKKAKVGGFANAFYWSSTEFSSTVLIGLISVISYLTHQD